MFVFYLDLIQKNQVMYKESHILKHLCKTQSQ